MVIGDKYKWKLHYTWSDGTDDFDYWDEMQEQDEYFETETEAHKRLAEIEKIRKLDNSWIKFIG